MKTIIFFQIYIVGMIFIEPLRFKLVDNGHIYPNFKWVDVNLEIIECLQAQYR